MDSDPIMDLRISIASPGPRPQHTGDRHRLQDRPLLAARGHVWPRGPCSVRAGRCAGGDLATELGGKRRDQLEPSKQS